MHIYLLMTSPCVETINIFYIIHYISCTYFRTNSRPHNRVIFKISMLCKFSDPNYECHNDLATRSNSTGLKKTFKTAQKRNVKPGMATYGYNSMLCKFSNPNYECHNDLATWSNSTGLKKTFKTAQKTKVEPDMTTYWFNSVIYMYFITNLTWHHFLPSMIVKCP